MNIRLSGAICGQTWLPQILAGIPGNWDITQQRPRIISSTGDPILIADVVSLILNENGGDFQHALFTGDTEIIFEFKKPTPRGYTYHCRVYELRNCPSLTDYCDADVDMCDFMYE